MVLQLMFRGLRNILFSVPAALMLIAQRLDCVKEFSRLLKSDYDSRNYMTQLSLSAILA